MEIKVLEQTDIFVSGTIGDYPFRIMASGTPLTVINITSRTVFSKQDLIDLREYLAIYLRMCNDVEFLWIDGAVKKWELSGVGDY